MSGAGEGDDDPKLLLCNMTASERTVDEIDTETDLTLT